MTGLPVSLGGAGSASLAASAGPVDSAGVRPQVAIAWLALRRRPFLMPSGAALGLAVVTVPWHDSHGVLVLHGVSVLSAAALAAATDDPMGEVADGAPTRRGRRTGVRVGLALAVVLPLTGLAALAVELREAVTPVTPALVAAVGWSLLAVALGTGLRAWRGVTTPAYPAAVGLLVAVVAAQMVPRGWTLVDPQPFGPPWESALWRWAGLSLVLVGITGLALRDPAESTCPPA